MELEVQEQVQVRLTDAEEIAKKASQPGHLFYHAKWLDLLSQQYGYQFWQTYNEAEDEFMLFAHAKGVMGPKLVSLPFSDYTIPHVPAAHFHQHINALRTKVPAIPILVKLTDNYISPQELAAAGEPLGKAYLHRVPLEGALENRMTAAFKRGVRKANRNKLTTKVNRSPEALTTFYEIYYRLRTQKLGLIPQPLTFFEKVYEVLIKNGEGFFFEARQGEEVLASVIVLREGEGLYYKWGCSLQDKLYLRPNNLLFCELLNLAKSMGCRFLDLGLSDIDETRGLIRFKESMGGEPSTIYSYCFCPPDYPLELEKQLKGLINQVAKLVVDHKLQPTHTEAFSQALYPLFV